MLPFSSQNQHDAQSVALRESLLDQMQQETEQFRALVAEYDDRDPSDEAVTQHLCREIVNLVDRVLAIEGWELSLFLRNLMKPLIEAKEQAQAILDESGAAASNEEQAIELKDNEQLLYMTLYQAQGHDLQAWALQLKSIKHTMLGRPLYNNEEAAKAKVRAKVDQSCDAYVVIRVHHDCQLELPDSIKRTGSQLEHKVIMLEQGCLSVDNIVEFHYMKHVYTFEKGQLIQK